jgi:hypothetical protein
VKVSEVGRYVNLSASGAALSGAGVVLGVFVASASATPTIKLWDNTAGSGAVLVNTFTPVAGTYYPIPAKVNTGCYVTISGTVDCTVFIQPIAEVL